MLGDTFDQDPFKDYTKADNSDDEEMNNDLQARLYAEIYYQSNIDGNWEANGTPTISERNDTIDEPTIKPGYIQYQKFLESETDKESMTDPACTMSKVQESDLTGQIESIKAPVQPDRDNPTDRETTDTADLSNYNNSAVYDNTDNATLADSSATGGGEKSKKSSPQTHKSSKRSIDKHQRKSQKGNAVLDNLDKDTKYNVLSKMIKQKMLAKKAKASETSGNNSDSEESIFEVPLPPKPTPPLIILQDSDAEDSDSLIPTEDAMMEKWRSKYGSKDQTGPRISVSTSPELEIVDVPIDRDTTVKNKPGKAARNKDTPATRRDKSARNTRGAHEIGESIVLNCTTVQKGVGSIDEIRQLSKSCIATTRDPRLRKMLDASKNSKGKSSQSVSKGNDKDNASEIPQCNAVDIETAGAECDTAQHSVNLRQAGEDLMNNALVEVSCVESNMVLDRKRHRENDGGGGAGDNNFAQKRQCDNARQNDRNASTLQSGGAAAGKRSQSYWNDYFFKPMSEELRRFYNDSRGQENFDVGMLQRGMSKDPKMWAILDVDLLPTKHGGRYWSNVRCNYCQRDGHLRKDCPEPPKPTLCYMCGAQGHTERRCPYKVCLTCGKKQNMFRKTCDHCRTLFCTMCNSIGHRVKKCPDLWRRYHQTTHEIGGYAPPDPGNVMKPASQLYCCNCTKRGHEASTCTEYRWSLHFSTPAAVTSYTAGPIYEQMLGPVIEPAVEPNFAKSPNISSSSSSIRTRSGKTLMPAVELNFAKSPNISSSSSSIRTRSGKTLMPAEEHTFLFDDLIEQLIRNNGKPMGKPLQPRRLSQMQGVLNFVRTLYSCGSCCDKNNAWMLLHNLSINCKKIVQDSLVHGKIVPTFFENLQKKVNFEIRIGQVKDSSAIILHLIALKDCLNPLLNLLLYWKDLPDEEKSYGVDVSLSANTTEMLYLLTSKNWEFENKSTKDLIEVTEELKVTKAKLELKQNTTSDEYFNLYEHLLNLHADVLAVFNVKAKDKSNMKKFHGYLNTLRQGQPSREIDDATYLNIILIYNRLFVPHTPPGFNRLMTRLLRRKRKEKRQQYEAAKQKRKSAPSTNPLLPQLAQQQQQQQQWDIDVAGDPTNAQNANYDASIETAEAINNEITILDAGGAAENCVQHSENITFDESVQMPHQSIVRSKYYRWQNDEGHLSTGNVNAEYNVQSAKWNATYAQDQIAKKNTKMSGAQKKKMKQQMKNDKIAKRNNMKQDARNIINQALYQKATKVAKEASAFYLPHMTKAAENLRRKMEDKTLKENHINTLRKMVELENKHQKNLNHYHSYLK